MAYLFEMDNVRKVSNNIGTFNKPNIWNICEEITSKQNWYSKIFNDDIVCKWKKETHSPDEFNCALKLLRATAQGVKYSETCEHFDQVMCKNCVSTLKQKLLKTPGLFGYEPKNVDDILSKDKWEIDFEDDIMCDHQRCSCIPPHHNINNYVEYYPEDLLPQPLHTKCKKIISEMAKNESIDWHPGSNNQVRDIIHPSMYCYVKGTSIHYDDTVGDECNESDRYQWLPSEFYISPDGTTNVATYINNLDEEKHPLFLNLVEQVFKYFVSPLEKVLGKKLTDRTLQVIVKVGSIILTPENNEYPGGSWHIEGVPYEYIAATCIHYVETDNITDSFLEFRKPTIINEDVDYPQSDVTYTEHHYGVLDHFDGIMNRYLGLIRCHEGASVIFPNTIQHRVKDFMLADTSKPSTRTILTFFVIDPDHCVISTEDIPPQQNVFTLEQARHYRERLMHHRKYFVDQLNKEVFERPFSLCEH